MRELICTNNSPSAPPDAGRSIRNYERGWRPVERAATVVAPLVSHTRRRHVYRNDPLGAALRTLHLALDLGNRTWKLAFATSIAHAPRLRTRIRAAAHERYVRRTPHDDAPRGYQRNSRPKRHHQRTPSS